MASEEAIASAIALLRSAVPHPDTLEAAALRAQLMPAIAPIVRREKRQQKMERREEKERREPSGSAASADAKETVASAPPHELPLEADVCEVDQLPSVLTSTLSPTSTPNVDRLALLFWQVSVDHFSRLLYPNPVCLLSTWQLPEDAAGAMRIAGPLTNLMTISWLTPLDNAGRFACSMCQQRFSAVW